MSADDLMLSDEVTATQKVWLQEFCQAWDSLHSEKYDGARLRTPLELAGMFVTVLREMLPEESFGLCMRGRIEPDSVCDSKRPGATTRECGRVRLLACPAKLANWHPSQS